MFGAGYPPLKDVLYTVRRSRHAKRPWRNVASEFCSIRKVAVQRDIMILADNRDATLEAWMNRRIPPHHR